MGLQKEVTSRRFWIAAGLILTLALALRLVGLNKGLWIDEYETIYKLAGNHGLRQTTRALRYDIHPPLYFWMLEVWRRVGGDAEWYLRLLTVATSMIWLGLTMAWLKLYHRGGALLAGIMLATTPFVMRYGQEIRGYALLCVAGMAAFFFASRFLRDPQQRYAWGASLALTVAVCTHVIGVFLPVAVLVFALLESRSFRILRGFALWVLVPPYLATLLLLKFYFVTLEQQGRWIPPVSWTFFSDFALSFVGGSAYALDWVLIGIALTAALFGNWKLGLPFLGAAAAFVAQALLYSLAVRSVMVDRYFLTALTLVIAWCGVQLGSIERAWIRRVGIASVVLLAATFGVQWVQGEAAQPVERWRRLGEMMTPPDASTPVLVAPEFAEEIFEHYAPAIPPAQIVPVVRGGRPDLSRYKAASGGLRHVILVLRGPDGDSFMPFQPMLQSVLEEVGRPGVVEVFLVSPDPVRLDQMVEGTNAILGQPTKIVREDKLGWLRFEF